MTNEPEPEEIVSRREEETEAAGERLARALGFARLVLLDGDLGAGKTTFVRGFARGLGLDPAEVTSPTFALLHEYSVGGEDRPRLRHLDLYRIGDLESIRDVGLLEILDSDVPTIVEWPSASLAARPAAIVVRIAAAGETSRRISIRRASPDVPAGGTDPPNVAPG